MKGFTLIEMLAGIVILGVTATIFSAVFFAGNFTSYYDGARVNAQSFSQRNGYRLDSCMAYDSDSDGYITCQAFDKEDRPVPLQCSYWLMKKPRFAMD